MGRKFAVFDIDGTIARTSLLQLMVKELVARGKISHAVGLNIDSKLHDYRQRIPDEKFGAYMKQAVDTLFQSVQGGITSEEYSEMVNNMTAAALSDTYVYTRQLIQSLKKNGFFLISISGAEIQSVEAFSKALGFDAWVGEVSYVRSGGHLTGEVQALNKPKSEILKGLMAKHDLSPKGSMAIGDTSSDIGILQLAESPVAFNPNQQLFRAADKNDWMIVVERKDMVYGMVKENGGYLLKQVNA